MSRNLFTICAAALCFAACADRNAVEGVYTGTIPAADCPGIEVELTLYDNGTYSLKYDYMERDSEFVERGTYVVKGDMVTVTSDAEGSGQGMYRREKDALRMLDTDGNEIKGETADMYVLVKTDDKCIK